MAEKTKQKTAIVIGDTTSTTKISQANNGNFKALESAEFQQQLALRKLASKSQSSKRTTLLAVVALSYTMKAMCDSLTQAWTTNC
jgi:hypothetical protein